MREGEVTPGGKIIHRNDLVKLFNFGVIDSDAEIGLRPYIGHVSLE